MKEKRAFYYEIAYTIALIILALGTSLTERAGFGMSMIVAPVYIIYLKVSELLPFFTFGMAEYLFQALVLVILSTVMRKFKRSYLLSFVTAFVYGIVLDVVLGIVGLIPPLGTVWNHVFFILGTIICSFGVALLLHANFPPAAYELFVKELSQKTNKSIGKVKTVYDYCSCILSIALSLLFFGTFVGVKWGTVLSAVFNGWLIQRFSRILEHNFIFTSSKNARMDKL